MLGGKLVANLVDALADGWDKTGDAQLLPPGIGLNVNFPVLNSTCSYAPYTLSRELYIPLMAGLCVVVCSVLIVGLTCLPKQA